MAAPITTDDARLIAEQLADVLEERGLTITSAPTMERVLDVPAVAELLGRSTDWVYEHARELGGFRMGEGSRAPIGFDRAAIETWKRAHTLSPTPSPTTRETGRRPRPRRTKRAADPDLIPFEEQA